MLLKLIGALQGIARNQAPGSILTDADMRELCQVQMRKGTVRWSGRHRDPYSACIVTSLGARLGQADPPDELDGNLLYLTSHEISLTGTEVLKLKRHEPERFWLWVFHALGHDRYRCLGQGDVLAIAYHNGAERWVLKLKALR